MVYGFPGGSDGKQPTSNAGDPIWSLGWEDSLEKEMATHSSILVYKQRDLWDHKESDRTKWLTQTHNK